MNEKLNKRFISVQTNKLKPKHYKIKAHSTAFNKSIISGSEATSRAAVFSLHKTLESMPESNSNFTTSEYPLQAPKQKKKISNSKL